MSFRKIGVNDSDHSCQVLVPYVRLDHKLSIKSCNIILGNWREALSHSGVISLLALGNKPAHSSGGIWDVSNTTFGSEDILITDI